MSDEISFYKALEIHAPREFAYRWHTLPGTFERLVPPWLNLTLLQRSKGIEEGSSQRFRIKYWGISREFEVQYFGYQPPEQFCCKVTDSIVPYWEHYHRFIPQGRKECVLQDHIRYRLPFYLSSKSLIDAFNKELSKVYAYRHSIEKQDIEHHYKYSKKPLKIAVTGAHGFIGSALVAFLRSGGHEVFTFTRNRDKHDGDIFWDPEKGFIERDLLEGLDAVVNLAGESIFQGNWTKAKKEKIMNSRIVSTRLLSSTFMHMKRPPDVFISASATGYYRSDVDTVHDEVDSPGSGFLANVCEEWERQAESVAACGTRVVIPRIGVVLSPQGGMLRTLLPFYRFGLGFRVGNDEDYLSWISLDDAISLIHYLIVTPEVHGPINLVAPNPVTQYEFANTLGSILHRPYFFRVPSFVLKTIGGEKAQNLCSSNRVSSSMAQGIGYKFRHPYLINALKNMFGVVHRQIG